MSFTVFTDTSANLPTALTEEKHIKVIGFSYAADGEEKICLDTSAFDGKAYYDSIRAGAKVTTSLIPPTRYTNALTPVLEAGEDALLVLMSSGISSSFRSAQAAIEHLRKKFPERKIEAIDTKGASLGEGIPVLEAARCRDLGLSLEETAERVREKCRRMYQVFVVDDLMHLKRTGRCSNASAIMGTVLQIKPLLKGDENGKIVTFDKVRGKRKAIEVMADKYAELAVSPETQTVGIAHADCDREAMRLAELINKKAAPEQILMVMYEPVTGSHVGPGTLALFFEGADDVRSK